jgi:hypothetical protein
MFKRNKITEHINLLEVESQGSTAGRVKADKSFPLFAAVGVGVALVCVLGAWAVLGVMDASTKREIAKLRADIDSPETAAKLQQYDNLLVIRDNVNAYAVDIQHTAEAYKSLPVVNREYYEAIEEAVNKVAEENAGTSDPAVFTSIDYNSGTFTVPLTVVSKDEFAQKYPAALVQYFYDNFSDKFTNVEYNGYAAADVAATDANGAPRPGQGTKQVSFNLVLHINNEKQLPNVKADSNAGFFASPYFM